MGSTATAVSIFVSLLIVSAALWAGALWLGLRWARVPGVTAGRVVGATIAIAILQGVIECLVRLIKTDGMVILGLAAAVIAGVWIPCLLISRLFKVPMRRAFKAWLPTLLPAAGMLAFAFLAFKPLVYEAFTTSSMAMAPTLIGRHVRDVCPECGHANYDHPPDVRYGTVPPVRMMCDNFHVADMATPDARVYPADRFLVAKFLKPRRWDIVLFQYPEDESILYVMRLVGLPGERIHIDDGAVWADGRKLTPPPVLDGIEYLSWIPDWPRELWGSLEQPALLGADEYFVLGDFSPRAMDSRFWQRGTPGHHPYAVPESHLHGVVTHIYWPAKRWRVLRQ